MRDDEGQHEGEERSAYLRMLENQFPAILWTTDTSLCFTSSSGAGLGALGLQPNEVVGLNVQDFFRVIDADGRALDAHRRALQGEAISFEQSWQGRTFHAQLGPLCHLDGAIKGTVGIALDTTDYRKATETLNGAQEALRESEERFRSLVQNSSDIITVLEADGTIRYESPSLHRLLGYRPEEIIGKNAFEFVHPEDLNFVLQTFLARLQIPGTIPDIEFRFRHNDGSWRTLEAIGNNLLHDPQVKGVVINSRDITERKQLEDQLRQSQKMEAVGQLAGGMAHDFNNLLTIISGQVEIQLEQMDSSDPLRRPALEVRKAAEQASSLISRVMAFSRKEVTQLEVLDVRSVVAETGRMLPRLIGENIKLVIKSSNRECFVKADATQLQQILVNLAVNARDAMPQGGELIVEVSPVELDASGAKRQENNLPGPYVLLSVTDNGCGMDESTQRRVFEPFFTTKKKGKGTGLGLSIVYSIVRQSGGSVSVHSRVEHGSTFTILWPSVQKQPKRPEPQPLLSEPAGSGSSTILLVDDETGVREMVSDYLRARGYSVFESSDGIEALDILCHKQEGKIDLIVSDVVMPRMGGRELASRLRELGNKTRILYTSGYTGDGAIPSIALEPDTFFIQKPFSLKALARKVGEALKAQESAAGSSPQPPDSSMSCEAAAGNG
jgi:two-component system cell cycle sensor histidine kinase/response regulator CckA